MLFFFYMGHCIICSVTCLNVVQHLRKSELQKKEEEAEIEVERLKKELETKTTEVQTKISVFSI